MNLLGFQLECLLIRLKYRREAAEFIEEMAERLNHNIPQHG
uniref:Uncharacterized protein n=1 Tax=Meloidogyne enterolobii TaxID=390850 RepID=A0A6V7TQR5_MELEN|nr:unnamed protein product [Meloidogyne enterolobii]